MRKVLLIGQPAPRRQAHLLHVCFLQATDKLFQIKRSYLPRAAGAGCATASMPSVARTAYLFLASGKQAFSRNAKDHIYSTATTASRATGGFTLIELTVVIVLISLFAAFTLPKIGNIGAMKLTSEGRRIARVITYMHTQAGASQKLLRLSFNTKSGDYFASFLNSEDQFERISFSLFSGKKLSNGIHIEKFTTLFSGAIVGNEANLHFLAEGFTEKAVIVLADKKKRKLSLIVDPLTGRVKIKKGDIKFEYLEIEARNIGEALPVPYCQPSLRKAV